MKKLLLSAAAVMAFAFATAQESTSAGFSQGDVFITGSVGFSNTKEGEAKTNNLTVSPTVAYFITQNIALGGQLTLGSGKTEVGDAEAKNNTFNLSAIGRYYFTPANNFSLFGQGELGYLSTKDEPAGGGEDKRDGFKIGVGAGMNYFVSSNFAIEANLGLLSYQSTKADVDGAESRNEFNLGLDFSNVSIGVLYKF